MKSLANLLVATSIILSISPIEPVSSKPAYCNDPLRSRGLPPAKQKICDEGGSGKYSKGEIDSDTGLNVVIIQRDDDWDQSERPSIPFSRPVKNSFRI